MDIIRSNKYRIWIKLITFTVITALLCQNIAWAGWIESVLQADISINELDVLAPQSIAEKVSGSMAFLQMYNDLMDAEKRPRVLATWEIKRKKLLDLSAIEKNRFSIRGLKRRFKEDFTEQEKESFARDLEFLQQNIFPELTEEQARMILDKTYPSGVYLTLEKEMFKKGPIQMLFIYFVVGLIFFGIIYAIRYESIIAIIFLLPFLMFFLFQLGCVFGFFSSIYFEDAGIIIIRRNRQTSFIHEVTHYIGDRIYKDQKDKIFASAIEFIRQDDPIRYINTFNWLERSRIKSFNKGISFIRDRTLLERVKADFIPVAYLESIEVEYHDGADMIAGMAYEISQETRNRQDACTFIRLLYKGYSIVQAELAVRIETEYRLLKQEESSLRGRVITYPEAARAERPLQILLDCLPGEEIDLKLGGAGLISGTDNTQGYRHEKLKELSCQELQQLFPQDRDVEDDSRIWKTEVKAVLSAEIPATYLKLSNEWVNDSRIVLQKQGAEGLTERQNAIYRLLQLYANLGVSIILAGDRVYIYNSDMVLNLLAKDKQLQLAADGLYSPVSLESFFVDTVPYLGGEEAILWGLPISSVRRIRNENSTTADLQSVSAAVDTYCRGAMIFDQILAETKKPEELPPPSTECITPPIPSFLDWIRESMPASGMLSVDMVHTLRRLYGDFGRGDKIAAEAVRHHDASNHMLSRIQPALTPEQVKRRTIRKFNKALRKAARLIGERPEEIPEDLLIQLCNRICINESEILLGTEDFEFSIYTQRGEEELEETDVSFKLKVIPAERIVEITDKDKNKRRFSLSESFNVLSTKLKDLQIVTKEGNQNLFQYAFERNWVPSGITLEYILSRNFTLELFFGFGIDRSGKILFSATELGHKSITAIITEKGIEWNKTVDVTQEQAFAVEFGKVRDISLIGIEGSIIIAGHTHPTPKTIEDLEKGPKFHKGDIYSHLRRGERIGKTISAMIVETIHPQREWLVRIFLPRPKIDWKNTSLIYAEQIESNLEEYFDIIEIPVKLFSPARIFHEDANSEIDQSA